MLININIIGFKLIDINVAKKTAWIGSCNIKVKIYTKFYYILIYYVVYIKTGKIGITVSAFFTIKILVYFAAISSIKNFLFKPFFTINSIFLYIYLVNNNIDYVVARNNILFFVKIPRNLRLGILSEINYNNCFYVTENAVYLLKLAVQINIKSK